MSTKSAVSIEEYLRTSFDDYDREYVDGEIVERPLPDNPHSETELRLLVAFSELGKTRPFFPRPNLRLQVTQTRVRIPDISVYFGSKPTERYPRQPPLVAVEILSPDDRYLDLMQKFEEYHQFGVPNIWFVDPQRRKLQKFTGVLTEVSALEIPEYDVRITAAEIFG